jgi:hypothetical protein
LEKRSELLTGFKEKEKDEEEKKKKKKKGTNAPVPLRMTCSKIRRNSRV